MFRSSPRAESPIPSLYSLNAKFSSGESVARCLIVYGTDAEEAAGVSKVDGVCHWVVGLGCGNMLSGSPYFSTLGALGVDGRG